MPQATAPWKQTRTSTPKDTGQYGVEHTITLSLTRHRGLFDTVYGTVRNLRLQGNVSSSEGNVGAIAGTLGNGAWVVDCVNWANVTGILQRRRLCRPADSDRYKSPAVPGEVREPRHRHSDGREKRRQQRGRHRGPDRWPDLRLCQPGPGTGPQGRGRHCRPGRAYVELDLDQSTINRLRTELDTLHTMVNGAADDMDGSTSLLNTDLNTLNSQMDTAVQAARRLQEQGGDYLTKWRTRWTARETHLRYIYPAGAVMDTVSTHWIR